MYRLHTLQHLELRAPDHRILNVGEKPCALLALLAEAGPAGVARDVCRTFLWESAPPANSSNSLRQALFRLRRALGPESIADEGGRLMLRVPLTTDLADLELHIHEGRFIDGLDGVRTPIGTALAVGGPTLRRWLTAKQQRIEARLVHVVTTRWALVRRLPTPTLIEPLLTRALCLFPHQADLRWLQAELIADTGTLADLDQLGANLLMTAPPSDRQRWEERLGHLRATAARRATGSMPTGPRFVLHRATLELLERSWRQGQASAPSVVWIEASAGGGRTWLLREFARRTTLAGGRVIRLTANPSAGDQPGACLRDLTKALTELRGAAGIDPKYAGSLTQLLGNVHPLPGDAVDTVMDLVSAICDEGPLALLLDDAHYCETSTLRRLIRHLSGRRLPGLLTVVTARAGASVRPDGVPVVALPPLDTAGIDALLADTAHLPPSADRPHVLEHLLAHPEPTAGRVVEQVLALLADGRLAVSEGQWRFDAVSLRAPSRASTR